MHYLPSILGDGALYPKSVLKDKGIAPRSTAHKRDRALGLTNYVHVAMSLHTPLLMDKLNKGFPHAVLVLDGHEVFSIPGISLIPQNTKAWRMRSAYVPTTDPVERDALLKQWTLGRHQSLEVLVPYGLSLEYVQEIVFFHQEHLDLFAKYISKAHPEKSWPLVLEQGLSRSTIDELSDDVRKYLNDCIDHGSALQPPSIPL